MRLLLFLLMNAAPGLLLERGLGRWRRRGGTDRRYVVVSALLRTVAYSPCLVPVMMTLAIPVTLPVYFFLWAVNRYEDSAEPVRAYFLFGIPELVVFWIAYARAEAHQRRRLWAEDR